MTTVTLTGGGTIGAHEQGWSVREEATPVAIGDSNGSTGVASLNAAATPTSDYITNNPFLLTHSTAGRWRGRVASIDLEGVGVDLSINGPFEFLNVTRTARPAGRVQDVPGVLLGTLTISGTSLAVDSSGNIFTGSSNTMRKYNSSGALLTSWGGFGTADGLFNTIVGVAVDSTGAVYVVDQGNNRIQKFTNAGAFTLKWGTSGSGDGQFSLVQGIGISPTNEVYTVEFGNRRVQKFNTVGTFQTKWGSFGTGTSQFANPNSVATDPAGNVYVTDNGNDRVQKFTNTGTFVLLWGGTDGYGEYQFKSLQSVAVSTSGLVMVVDSLGQQVKVYTTAGVFVTRWGSAASGFTFPIAVAIGPTGTINVLADTGTNVMYQYGYSSFGGELLSSVFDSYLRLCDPNRTRDQFRWLATVDPIVNFPGWRDKVWPKIKDLCAAYHVQMDMVDGVVTVNDIGSRTLTVSNNTPIKLSPVMQGGGKQVNIVNQNQTSGALLTMYSAYADGNTVHTIDVQGLKQIVKQTNSHPITLNAPTPTDTRPVTSGTYGVQDSAGAAIPATTWAYYGGKIDATIGDQPGQIVLTLTGPKGIIPGFTGPFSIASGTSALNTRRGELEVTGAGVVTDPITIGMLTAADPGLTTQDVARTVNNVFIGSKDQAYSRGAWAVDQVTGPGVTISFNIPVSKLQGFGLVNGSLIRYRDCIFRVITVAYGNVAADVTAVWHVTGTDFKTAFPSTLLGTNLATNPSYETATTGYLTRTATGGVFAPSLTAVTPYVGSSSLRVTANTAAGGPTVHDLQPAINLVTGDVYYYSFQIRPSFTGTFRPRLVAFTGPNGTGTPSNIDGADLSCTANVWTAITPLTGTIGASIMSVIPAIRPGGVAETFPLNATIDIDAVLVTKDGTTTYFSGATTGAGEIYGWRNTTNASESYRFSGTVTDAAYTTLWAGYTAAQAKIKPLRVA